MVTSTKRTGKRVSSSTASRLSELSRMSCAELALRFSMPPWIVQRWIDNFGKEEALAILTYSSEQPRIVLRTNEMAITTEGLVAILENKGVKVSISELVNSCLLLESKGDPSKLAGYEEGLFSIQDDTAALVARVVDPKPGETILDLCAAPGGKALYLGELMENRGRVIAVDKQANRLELLKKNRRRLSISNVEVVAADGRTFTQDKLVDRALVDAPCTGTGVLNRKADLRYRREPEDIISLAEIQNELLANAARLLKPGGVLVYATCSLEPEENQAVIDNFLSQHSDFHLDDLTPFFPKDFAERFALADKLKSGQLQILPSMDGLSGFFLARLIRNVEAD